jgi:hypothetical protein
VRHVCMKTGLRPLYEAGDGGFAGPGRVVLLADVVGDMKAPAAFSSSFMVLVNSLSRVSGFVAEAEEGEEAGGAGREVGAERLELQLTFYADPKWRILEHPGQTLVESVADDRGNPLPRPAAMVLQSIKEDSPIWQMRTTVRGVPPGCTRLTKLKGTFRVVLLEQSEPVEVADVLTARNVLRRVGGQSVVLQEVTRQKEEQPGQAQGGYQVKLMLSRNGLSQRPWRQAREVEGIRLFDANGRPMMRASYDVKESGEQVLYDLEYYPGAAPAVGDVPILPQPRNVFGLDNAAGAAGAAAASPPARLVCQVPLEPREVTVPFEFGEIPVER